jgi:uncharacterized protein (UPF0332 family)
MTVTPRQLLDHAKALKQQDELGYRVCINRGYYGVYHAARQFHEALPSPGRMPDQTLGGMGVHATLYHQLTHPTIPSSDAAHTLSKKLGYKARELKEIREHGDYELDAPIGETDADFLIAQAEKTLGLLGQ